MPLVEFRLRLESSTTCPSQSAATNQLLSWASGSLQHIRRRGSTYREPSTARYGPPSGFGHPLGGLRPSLPCRLCFTPTALMGFALRSFLLSWGKPSVSAQPDPHTVFPVVATAAKTAGRPHGPRFLGFDPHESPWRSARV